MGEGRYRFETRDKILIVDMPLLDCANAAGYKTSAERVNEWQIG